MRLFVWSRMAWQKCSSYDFDGLLTMRAYCFRAKRSNAYRHHRMTLAEILSQLVVERANAGGLGGFDLSRHGRLHCDC